MAWPTTNAERADNPNLRGRDPDIAQLGRTERSSAPSAGIQCPFEVADLMSNHTIPVTECGPVRGAKDHQAVIGDLVADVEHGPVTSPVHSQRSADPHGLVASRAR